MLTSSGQSDMQRANIKRPLHVDSTIRRTFYIIEDEVRFRFVRLGNAYVLKSSPKVSLHRMSKYAQISLDLLPVGRIQQSSSAFLRTQPSFLIFSNAESRRKAARISSISRVDGISIPLLLISASISFCIIGRPAS